MAKLTVPQKCFLRALVEIEGFSIQNAVDGRVASRLAKIGLIQRTYKPTRAFPFGLCKITDAGRAALHSGGREA